MGEMSVPPRAAGGGGVEIAPAHDAGGRGPKGRRGEVRDRIREVARRAFMADGYDGVTIREVARLADCDAAMITYYFGSKQELFRECFDLPIDPASELLGLVLPDPSLAGERIVRHVLRLYEERITAGTMAVLMRALMSDVATSQRFRNYFRSQVLDKVARQLGGGPQAALQIELAMSQIYGVVTMRYLVRLEPLASMPRERVVAELAPLVQARINRVIQARF
ncbi:MAG: TetR family transcriptional regulator [Arachnia sp.]